MAKRRRVRHSKLKMNIWNYLNEVGSANTHEIMDYLKSLEGRKGRVFRDGTTYTYGKSTHGGTSFTTPQLTNVLAKNRFFRKIGMEHSERRTVPEGLPRGIRDVAGGTRYKGLVPIYEAVSIEEMATWYADAKIHRIHTLEQLPKKMADAIEALIPEQGVNQNGGE
jgi:hypothetical protein